jgi:two-component system, NarL family, sensor kinase
VLLLSSEIARFRASSRERRELARLATEADVSAREALADDLHDGPIQRLAAVAMRVETRQLRPDHVSSITDNEIVSELRASSADLRSLMFDLSPGLESSADLDRALRKEATSTFARSPVRWSVTCPHDIELSHQAAVTLYRVAREGLANVLRHADASRVSIVVSRDMDGVRILIEDDGVGASSAVFFVPRVGHRGLLALRARLVSAGGWLRLDSAVGHGTKLQAWVPATPAEVLTPLIPASDWGGNQTPA